jgi:hypothetical protein
MADFCGFLSHLSENRKKIKISLKKRLTFLEVQFIVYGLSKLGRLSKVESNLWNAEKIRNIVNKSSSSNDF